MEVLTERQKQSPETMRRRMWVVFEVIGGALFLAALSRISISLHPVPMTSQTLGVFLLALCQRNKIRTISVIVYLLLASVGLPVLPGQEAVRPFWIFYPSAGYLVAFPISAYCIGKIVDAKENPSLLRIVGSLCFGSGAIFILGVGYLTRFLSLTQSVSIGLIPFLPVEAVKILVGASIGGRYLRWKKGG